METLILLYAAYCLFQSWETDEDWGMDSICLVYLFNLQHSNYTNNTISPMPGV